MVARLPCVCMNTKQKQPLQTSRAEPQKKPKRPTGGAAGNSGCTSTVRMHEHQTETTPADLQRSLPRNRIIDCWTQAVSARKTVDFRQNADNRKRPQVSRSVAQCHRCIANPGRKTTKHLDEFVCLILNSFFNFKIQNGLEHEGLET